MGFHSRKYFDCDNCHVEADARYEDGGGFSGSWDPPETWKTHYVYRKWSYACSSECLEVIKQKEAELG
jgi:hypothetical protein